MRSDLTGKSVVLGVTGGIAAYKACEVVSRLRKMGAEIDISGNSARIMGGQTLKGAEVSSTDLRAGAALVIAALAANGESVIDGIEFLERGYCNFDIKLRSLGADIRIVDIEG